jgi:hypothetical protein
LAIRGWRDIVFGISRYALYSASWALLVESVVAVVFSYWLVEPMAYWLSGNQDVAAITKVCCGLKEEHAIPYQSIFYSVALNGKMARRSWRSKSICRTYQPLPFALAQYGHIDATESTIRISAENVGVD